MTNIWILIASAWAVVTGSYVHAATECFGPKSASRALVYLHGMDRPSQSWQERENRKVLKQIAKAFSMRIALPRTERRCLSSPKQLCWGWAFDQGELESAAATVRRASLECFGADVKYTVIGFSNGGYFLSKLFRSCRLSALLPLADRLITIGAAHFDGTIESEPKSLKGCGSIQILSGDQDAQNSDRDQNLIRQIKSKGGHAEEFVFAGGHELPRNLLEKLLK